MLKSLTVVLCAGLALPAGAMPMSAAMSGTQQEMLGYDRMSEVATGEEIVLRGIPLPGGESVDIELTPFSVIGSETRFVYNDGSALVPIDYEPMRFFRGRVRGDASSRVFLGIGRDWVTGRVFVGDRSLQIGTLDPAEFDPAGALRVSVMEMPESDGAVASCGTEIGEDGIHIDDLDPSWTRGTCPTEPTSLTADSKLYRLGWELPERLFDETGWTVTQGIDYALSLTAEASTYSDIEGPDSALDVEMQYGVSVVAIRGDSGIESNAHSFADRWQNEYPLFNVHFSGQLDNRNSGTSSFAGQANNSLAGCGQTEAFLLEREPNHYNNLVILLHEIGHLLGLKHSNVAIPGDPYLDQPIEVISASTPPSPPCIPGCDWFTQGCPSGPSCQYNSDVVVRTIMTDGIGRCHATTAADVFYHPRQAARLLDVNDGECLDAVRTAANAVDDSVHIIESLTGNPSVVFLRVTTNDLPPASGGLPTIDTYDSTSANSGDVYEHTDLAYPSGGIQRFSSNLEYVPPVGFTGTDSFDYELASGDTGTVNVTVLEDNPAFMLDYEYGLVNCEYWDLPGASVATPLDFSTLGTPDATFEADEPFEVGGDAIEDEFGAANRDDFAARATGTFRVGISGAYWVGHISPPALSVGLQYRPSWQRVRVFLDDDLVYDSQDSGVGPEYIALRAGGVYSYRYECVREDFTPPFFFDGVLGDRPSFVLSGEYPDGYRQGARVTPVNVSSCQADFVEPFGVIDAADQDYFVYTAFPNQEPRADLAAPFGTFDLNDATAFGTAYTQGCP